MHFVELVSLQYCFILNVFVPDNPQPLETPSGKMETMASIKTNRGPVPHSHRHFIKAQLFQIFSNPICTSSTSKPLKNGDEIHIHLVPPAYSQQVSQEAFLIAGLLLLTGLCDPLLVFGSVLALFTRDTLLARCHGCHGLAAGSGWNWRAQPFNRDINNKYMYLIWPQARAKRILIWL